MISKKRTRGRQIKIAEKIIPALVPFVLIFFTACSDKAERRPVRNVLVVSIDSLRADHVGCYGYPKPTTPAMDEFAAGNLRFENSYSSSPWTLPTHASMFTGLTPTAHGATKFKSSLRPGAKTLASVLKKNGLKTVAVVCAPLLQKRYGLHNGFDIYDTDLIPPEYEEALLSKVAGKVTDKALKYFDENSNNPFFLFLHYWDPHYDYNPPKEYADIFDPDYEGSINGQNIRYRKDMTPDMNPRDLRHIVSLYDAEIRYTDDQIKRLLAGLAGRGLDSNTMVIITSDHGEEFLEHGWKGHTNTCYEESIKVPLMMKIPWVNPALSVSKEYVGTIDIFPTILDALNVKNEGLIFQGLSLMSTITQDKKLPRSYLTAETRYGHTAPPLTKVGPWKALITPDRHKFHDYGKKSKGYRSLLFDLDEDPGEQADLSEKRPELSGQYHKTLSDEFARQKQLSQKIKLSENKKLDKKTKEVLQGLGYVQ